MLPTDSAAERRLYEGFLEQLGEEFVIYHSVDWVVGGRAGRDEGEADFVITHPELGLLALEVKGGRVAFDPATKRWTQTGHSGTHVLDEDPFHQAKGAMHSLVRILEGQPGWERWKPSFGFGVAFPDGHVRDRGASGRARRDRDRSRRPLAARRTRSAGDADLGASGATVRRGGDGGRRDGARVPRRDPHAAQAAVRRGGQEDRRAHLGSGVGARVRAPSAPGGRDRSGGKRQDAARDLGRPAARDDGPSNAAHVLQPQAR